MCPSLEDLQGSKAPEGKYATDVFAMSEGYMILTAVCPVSEVCIDKRRYQYCTRISEMKCHYVVSGALYAVVAYLDDIGFL
jgi:hypothetical protein